LFSPISPACRSRSRKRGYTPTNLSTDAFLTYWLDNAIKGRKDPGTETLYRQRVRDHIVPYLGNKKLDKLRSEDIDQLLADLSTAGKSPDLQRKVGELLRRALKYAITKGYIHSNPALQVTLPKVVEQDIQPLTAIQVQKFLKAAQKRRHYTLYLLALDSGARQGEILALEWTDIDFETGKVSITKTVKTGEAGGPRVKEVKTRASRRRIKLSPRTLTALAEWRKKSKGQLVFPARGKGLTYGKDVYLSKASLLRAFRKVLRKAGLPEIRFHDLRHTHATLMLLKTKNIKAVSARLGHEDIKVTLDTYSHWMPEMEDEIVTALDEILVEAT
jgi:integrase